MRKERNEVKRNVAKAEKKARKIAGVEIIILTILVMVYIQIHRVFTDFEPKVAIKIIIIVGIVYVIVCGLGFYIFYKIYREEEINRLNSKYVEDCLKTEKYIEVIPISADNEIEEFILGLTDKAKFYAVIKDDIMVEIGVKFNDEEKMRELQTIEKEFFLYYYSIKE